MKILPLTYHFKIYSMNTKLLVLFSVAVVSFMLLPGMAYAQEPTPLKINTDIDVQQAIIILAIGIAGTLLTSAEGWHRSGKKFSPGKFLIAAKRTAIISVPSAFTMMLAFPEPTVHSYLVVGIAIILGAKMMHTKPAIPQLEKAAIAPVVSISTTPATTTVQSVSVSETITPDAADTSDTPTVTIPNLRPKNAKYQTNFVKGEKGNTILLGTDLWIRRKGVRSYVTAILRDAAENLIQVDQSHTKDEDGDIETIRLEMKAKDGVPLPRGKYTVQSQGDAGSSDSTGTKRDEFYIV